MMRANRGFRFLYSDRDSLTHNEVNPWTGGNYQCKKWFPWQDKIDQRYCIFNQFIGRKIMFNDERTFLFKTRCPTSMVEQNMKLTVFFSLFLAVIAFDYREFYKKYHQGSFFITLSPLWLFLEPSKLEMARSISDLDDNDLERYTRKSQSFFYDQSSVSRACSGYREYLDSDKRLHGLQDSIVWLYSLQNSLSWPRQRTQKSSTPNER